MADLITNLRVVQQYLGLSDEEMAERCGVRARMWQYVKAGSSRFGSQPLAAIVRTFPGARDDVFEYMAAPEAEAAPA